MPRFGWLDGLSAFTRFRMLMAGAFSGFFLFVAVTVGGLAVFELGSSLFDFLSLLFRGDEVEPGFVEEQENGDEELITGVINGINTAIIALASYELGMGIGKEYGHPGEKHNLYGTVRRTLTRFVSLACIALVLEALIMVIKYSQLDMAGNLNYPVAIIGGTSVLILALGGFLALTRQDGQPDPKTGGDEEPPGQKPSREAAGVQDFPERRPKSGALSQRG